jgi:hypothetical protein
MEAKMKKTANIDYRRSRSIEKRRTHKSHRTLSLLIAAAALLLLPIGSFAGTERYVLDFGDRHIKAQKQARPTMILLKQALNQQYPWVNTRNLRLKNVILVAKSKVGQGHAQLRVGNRITNFYRVAGFPKNFRRDHRRSFDRVRIDNPSRTSRGPWRINLVGNFKLRKIVLITEDTDERRRDYYSYRHRYYPWWIR